MPVIHSSAVVASQLTKKLAYYGPPPPASGAASGAVTGAVAGTVTTAFQFNYYNPNNPPVPLPPITSFYLEFSAPAQGLSPFLVPAWWSHADIVNTVQTDIANFNAQAQEQNQINALVNYINSVGV